MNKNIDEITCAKCGTRNPDCVHTKVEEVIRGSVTNNNHYYQAHKDAPRQNPLNKYIKCIKEHLRCTCWKCKYMWVEECLDVSENNK